MPHGIQDEAGAEAGGVHAGVATAPVPNTFTVFVAYNGLEKPVTANVHETVQALLTRSIQEFHVSHQPHILALFNQAGTELPDAGKVGEVGIRAEAHLLLRPSTVKGGAC